MTRKAVICTKQNCSHRYHQDVNLSERRIPVHHCPQCGDAGRMIMGPGQQELTGAKAAVFKPPGYRRPLLSTPVNWSLLRASSGDITLLHTNVVQAGYTLIGFHGCRSNAAESIITEVRDVSTTNARGSGFAVGSKYNGIPAHWSQQNKGPGTPTILRIYVLKWSDLTFSDDYDWGKMDPDDDVENDGLEMVLKVHTFSRIVALPSIGNNDQDLIPDTVWADCPTHNFGPDEMPKVTKLAQHLKITLNELDQWIASGKTGPIEEAAAKLGINL